MTRGEALAAVLSSSKSIIVAGTHGKTTTTSMVVSVLRRVGLDPTYLVGGGLNDAGTNARFGHGELSVAESDESDGSFLLLDPQIAVVTNIEADHLDHWGSIEAIREAFHEFLARVDESGTVVLPAADDALQTYVRGLGRRVITFGSSGDVAASGATPHDFGMNFRLQSGTQTAEVALRVPGEHNVSNALAAAAACIAAGVALEDVAAGLASYRGVERRFQHRGVAGGVTVIDDYAHHPTEIKATLAAARPGPWNRVVAVFQPHRYSRTAALGISFGEAFGDADRIVITDVYGAGEEPVPGVTGKIVSDAVATRFPGRSVAYLPHRSELLAYLQGTLRAGDAVLTLGAGDITSVGDELLALLEARG
jgi:UDP-N-acetylmuramate--alanine ligase